MNKHFNFKDLRVLNTRPQHLAKATSQVITKAGGFAVECPMLAIKSTQPNWVNTLPALNNIQHAIFTSPNAVTYFFKHYPSIKWPKTIKTYALGRGTQNALKNQGIFNPLLPKQADSEHLLLLDSLQAVAHENILLIKGKNGRTLIRETLVQRAANVQAIDVYQRVLPNISFANTQSLWHEDAVDIILITSETALQHLFILFGEQATSWLCGKPCLVISERLAIAARKKGFKTVIIHTI
ncbi:MAG: uroporphyrinogen-III synthase [Legionellaceae bacterium]|nr:uroporphyrinogen-III synthase [Legionellaceae bacterium]